ncbi:MAG: hypothetical protein AAFY24_25155, partial [Pseudomonadota bacterium]
SEPSSPDGILSTGKLEALRRRGREIEEFVQRKFFDKKSAEYTRVKPVSDLAESETTAKTSKLMRASSIAPEAAD